MRAHLLLSLTFASTLLAQPSLQSRIATIAATIPAKVSVACSLPNTPLNCDLNPDANPPMQSVFKFPLAVAVLHRADEGKLFPNQRAGQSLDEILDTPVRYLSVDIISPPNYSPLQDKYPRGNVDVPLRELITLSVSKSDNTASDILLRILGGPPVLDAYIHTLGVTGFQVRDNEKSLHATNALQYRNTFSPRAATQLLRLMADRSPLSPASTRFLNDIMLHATSGPHRIHGDLPEGTSVAHKTGTSGTANGMDAATNDIGLITLPNGQRLAIAIFVTDAHATPEAIEHVMAQIARAAYDEAIAIK
ncbi:class A beta-lactamase [Terriglobus saanensis]|uniref:beta-lactamase n=1 Tax=Terriglobus saanensis (strain ATCC BAA-1853 / DSM 23119 / SP1PR4) TaxID=401053 RepID=E8UZF8_TERSS|nr:class A beta-lactamase [Terriglobus saanensis]ADV83238.1 beta-lactamase [Terriglobus saanensis SP1PR4]